VWVPLTRITNDKLGRTGTKNWCIGGVIRLEVGVQGVDNPEEKHKRRAKKGKVGKFKDAAGKMTKIEKSKQREKRRGKINTT